METTKGKTVGQEKTSSDSDPPSFSFEKDRQSLHTTPALGTVISTHETPPDPGKDVFVKREENNGPDFHVIVKWDGKDDPENPFNWPDSKKWLCTIMFSLFTLLSPMSSTMVIPALDTISQDLNIPEGVQLTMVMSIFLLGYSLGPFILGPLSETYGRVKVLQGANLFYLVFNIGCAVAQSKNEILVFRFLSGIGGAAPQAIGHGYLADMWNANERGKSLAIYGIACWLGPFVAPIFGAYVAEYLTWRWVFWTISILCGCIQVLAIFFLKEAYEPVLLERKAQRIRKERSLKSNTGIIPGRMGKREEGPTMVRTEHHIDNRLKHLMKTRLSLTVIMMFTHPAVFLPSLYRAYLYGLMYLAISTFPLVWENIYHQSTTDASLNYLPGMVGMLVSLYVTSSFIDGYHERKTNELKEQKQIARRERLAKAHHNTDAEEEDDDNEEDETIPEWRIPPMLISGVLVPFGLLIYGWSAKYHVNPVVPNIGIFIFALGLLPGFNCPSAYITDTYGKEYTASASATGAFFRTMCGFSFPLFAPGMFAAWGIGWGTTVLAGLTLVMGVGPLAIYLWGPYLRAHSTTGMPKARETVKKDEEAMIEDRCERQGTKTVYDKGRGKAEDGEIVDGEVVTSVVEKEGDMTTPEGEVEITLGQQVVEEMDSPHGGDDYCCC